MSTKLIWILIPIILMNTISVSFAENFSDVKEGNEHFVAINYLKEKGIISGYEDGKFKPKDKINRAEALKMLTLASGIFLRDSLDNSQDDKRPFTDTPNSEWYTKYLVAAKEKGIISGYENGSFKPEKNINLAEALKIYLECFKDIKYPEIKDYLFTDAQADQWFAKYTAYAGSKGLLDVSLDNKIHPEQELTRGYLAEIIYRKLLSEEGYEFGKATFYGSSVQGSGTASGETFDKNALTAAHKYLPFGTIVEVTNMANGKSVQVKINDRGPYGPGRIIDLSSSAFAKIADLSTGVVNVQSKIIHLQ